ncbi:hypothetical protein WICPIJ_009842 [Wickerhamomyces pijperi]|uniref:Serine aminopeptidase S33 domain-containing protein n=1 Tax=Wickerhamomyces pijperi TaxID=599730 RepID=A0A9P8PLB7_WICPI|nr:hypothetical protein WICPIJ_009842 [Wickerhamomyces pijperi]
MTSFSNIQLLHQDRSNLPGSNQLSVHTPPENLKDSILRDDTFNFSSSTSSTRASSAALLTSPSPNEVPCRMSLSNSSTTTMSMGHSTTQLTDIHLKTREITFVKPVTAQTYIATLFTLPSNSPVRYKARVIILPNPGETVQVYLRTIEALLAEGYECFYYQTEMWRECNFNNNPINFDHISREMNRIIKMCVDDLDESSHIYDNSKIHLLGSFVMGSMALDYCVNDQIGYFNYRVKSVICVNPLIDVSSRSMFSSKLELKLLWKQAVSGTKKMTRSYKYSCLTNYKPFRSLLEHSEQPIGEMNVVYYQYLLKSIRRIRSGASSVHRRAARNTCIIQTDSNPFVKQREGDIEKSSQRFIDRIKPYVNDHCASKIIKFKATATTGTAHDAEQVNQISQIKDKQGNPYTPGVNLLLENGEIFRNTMRDVLQWLDIN